MSMKKLLVICTLIAFTSACDTETLVTKVDPSKTGGRADGVLFSLPETLVVVEIPVSKVSSSPGMFYKWTEFFYPELSSDGYVTEEGSQFKLGSPTFTTRGQTDPANVYMAHIKAKRFETKTLLLEFNEDGIIARTEASSKDESIDIITSGLKTAATIAAPLLPFNAGASASDASDLKRNKADDDEQYFRSKLNKRALALYDSLNEDTRKTLRNKIGYQFLLYVVQATSTLGNDAAGIEFFFTLNEDQWKIIESMPDTNAPCPLLPRGTEDEADEAVVAANEKAKTKPGRKKGNKRKPPPAVAVPVAPVLAAPAAPGPDCLEDVTLLELARALKAYNKIQELKLKRQDYLNEASPPQTTNSTLLEFRLKQVDDQIQALEQAYFLGTSSTTSSTSRFEFKPTIAPSPSPAIAPVPVAAPTPITKHLFTYSAAGRKPGICAVEGELSGEFKATWPKNLKGDCHAAVPDFERGDIRDLKALAKKLATDAADGADPVSTYLNGRLPNARNLLDLDVVDTPRKRDELLRALITDLNTVINSGASIYTDARFQAVQLSPDTIKLINTPGPSPAALNRLLIEDAYRSEIFRRSAWTPLQVSLRVDLPPGGFAKTVKGAQLSQPGKRGFPYRVPALTIAYLIDNDLERGRSDVRIAQFGSVGTLPANLGGRRSSYKITYYDASGAIKIFDMSADALIQKSNVTDITDAVTTLRDAETARLKRETEILKAKKEKLDAEKALRDAQEALEPLPSASPSPQ